ncbi:MAG: vWA domain-containing protein [Candidatus Ratteibacteria bacterium]
MKKLPILFAVLLFLGCLNSFAQRVDLIFLIDGSGSMGGQPFNTEKEGLASAIEDPTVVPTDGSVSVTVIQFSGGSPPDPDARIEVSPTLITSPAVAQQVASSIRNISILDHSTYFAPAFDLAVSTIMSWPQRAQRQVINLITDGNNSDQSETATAVANAMAAGIDLINVMGVGYGLDENNMWTIANPHYPGYPDPSRRPASPSRDYGYVWLLTGWEQFGPAVKQKILTEIHITVNFHDNYAGIPYLPVTITASGGVSPYRFQVVSGIPGLNLVQISPDIAELRGVPSTTGSYNVNIMVTDSSTPPIPTVVQGPVNILPPPYVAVQRTGGKILYVKSINRGIDGELMSTGNLFVKDIATKVENQLTNYTGNLLLEIHFSHQMG